MIKFIKKYYYYLLFGIGFIAVCRYNAAFDNDFWFLLNCGKYVLSNGIPFIDPFTIHEGLEYIMQQWLASVIFYSIYKCFGYRSIILFLYLIASIVMLLYNKLLNIVSNNNKLFSFIFTLFFIFIISSYITTRPQIFTYIFLIIELIILELYIKNKNKKYLYLLPIISILEVNLHMSMWLFLFLFLMPYYAEYIFNIIFKKDNFKIKPIIIVSILMLLGGLINPYTYKCFLFIYESYGSSNINCYISEMQSITFMKEYLLMAIFALVSFIIMALLIGFKKIKFRHLCLLLGCLILYFLHNKCHPYFYISYFVILADLFNNYEYLDVFNFRNIINKYKKIINILLVIIFSLIFIFINGIFIYSYINYSDYNKLDDMVNYLLDKYDKDDIKLYIDYDDGGYTEFRGIKSYMDPRAEVFLKKMNKKEDLFDEYYALFLGQLNINEFINKYHFTHLIVDRTYLLTTYLNDSNNYIVEYDSNGYYLFTSRSVYRE